MPASGLQAHTLISRFADHLPYYRQETINARSGVHTPRSTLAAWAGQDGAALEPLYDVHKRFVLGCRVLHGDETPVALLAKESMFLHTDTSDSPWTVIKSDCKKRARLNAMRYLLHRLPYRNKDASVIGTVDPLLVGRASLVDGLAEEFTPATPS